MGGIILLTLTTVTMYSWVRSELVSYLEGCDLESK